MIGMALENCKCPINLLQQNDSREFVRKRHFAQGDRFVGGPPRAIRKAVCRSDGKDDLLDVRGLLGFDELCQFL